MMTGIVDCTLAGLLSVPSFAGRVHAIVNTEEEEEEEEGGV